MDQDPSSFEKIAGVVDALTMDQNVGIEQDSVCARGNC